MRHRHFAAIAHRRRSEPELIDHAGYGAGRARRPSRSLWTLAPRRPEWGSQLFEVIQGGQGGRCADGGADGREVTSAAATVAPMAAQTGRLATCPSLTFTMIAPMETAAGKTGPRASASSMNDGTRS